MELRILCKHLVADELNGKFTVGEDFADVVGITLPRFYERHDLSQFSFRITAAGESQNAAVHVLEMDKFDEKSVHLLWNVTSDFTAIPEKFALVLTGVDPDNSVIIKFKSCPISVNSDETWEFLPSPELSEQLLNQTQSEVQKAVDAANRAEKASLTPAPAEIYPASTARLGGVKVDGITITASEDGTISAADNENIKAEIAELRSIIGLTDGDIIGLHADFENKIFTRLGAAAGKNAGADFDSFPMYGGRKRCNVLDNGTITAYYGDNNYAEDGSNGQVMVYQPKFYYKVVPLKLDLQTDGYGYHLRCANYYVSATPKSGFKLHPAFYNEDRDPVDYILFSAYEGSIFDTSANTYLYNDEQLADFSSDKLSSISGTKPCSGKSQKLTRANTEQLAKNRGQGWHIETIKSVSANQMLMVIEFADFNMQEAIGYGATFIQDISDSNCAVNSGQTSALGNLTGCASGDNGQASICYRGVENPWGNIAKYINGINIGGNGSQKGGVPYICEGYDFIENKNNENYISAGFTVASKSQYTSAFAYSEKCDWTFLTSETNGDNSYLTGDYTWISNNLNGYVVPIIGGCWYHGKVAGAFTLSLYETVSSYFRNYGSRIIYVPAQ